MAWIYRPFYKDEAQPFGIRYHMGGGYGRSFLEFKAEISIADAAYALDKAKMMRFDQKSGNFYCIELGRIASHFYIQYSSVETYNEMLKPHMNETECVLLYGPPGTGKTLLARAILSKRDANFLKGRIQLDQGSAGQVARTMIKEEGFGSLYKYQVAQGIYGHKDAATEHESDGRSGNFRK